MTHGGACCMVEYESSSMSQGHILPSKGGRMQSHVKTSSSSHAWKRTCTLHPVVLSRCLNCAHPP